MRVRKRSGKESEIEKEKEREWEVVETEKGRRENALSCSSAFFAERIENGMREKRWSALL